MSNDHSLVLPIDIIDIAHLLIGAHALQIVDIIIHDEGSSDDPGFGGLVISAMKEACRQVRPQNLCVLLDSMVNQRMHAF